jgi:hypothetical protein
VKTLANLQEIEHMKRSVLIIAVVVMAFATAALAQPARRTPRGLTFASDFQTVPVMANNSGRAGVRFQTFVAILNPTASGFAVQATLHDNTGALHEATINLAAGQQETFENFLDDVFHYTGSGAVTFRSPDSAGRFVVNAEIYTSTGERYGTAIPALEFAGTASASFVPGIEVGEETRTNIGCFNQSAAANNVKATYYDASGQQVLGTATLPLPANGWSQTNVTAIVSDGYVRFEPEDTAVCYAVVLDNETNDGRFLSAAEYTP